MEEVKGSNPFRSTNSIAGRRLLWPEFLVGSIDDGSQLNEPSHQDRRLGFTDDKTAVERAIRDEFVRTECAVLAEFLDAGLA